MADNKLPENLPNRRRTWLTPRQKLALIRQVEEGRFSISEACRRAGISRFTFYKWRKSDSTSGELPLPKGEYYVLASSSDAIRFYD